MYPVPTSPAATARPYSSDYRRFDDDENERPLPPFTAPRPLAVGGFAFEDGERQPPSRFVNRTPSPTPSEHEALQQKGLVNLKGSLNNFKKRPAKEKIWIYIIAGILIAITILLAVFHKQIVNWLQPVANKLHGLPAGWLVPIAILFVLSFPPLFGQEIVMVLCGLVWGLWAGFGIVAAGTFLGEVGNFFAFKHFCSARGKRWEKTKIDYACLSRVFQEGGVIVAIVARYSILPPHFTTAVFATCGMRFWVFAVAAIASLPRHFVTVYLGVLLEDEAKGQNDTKDKIVTYAALAVTIVITYFAVRYIGKLVNDVKPQIIYERRKARQQNKLDSSSLSINESIDLVQPTPTPSMLEGGNRGPVYAPPQYDYGYGAEVPQSFGQQR